MVTVHTPSRKATDYRQARVASEVGWTDFVAGTGQVSLKYNS